MNVAENVATPETRRVRGRNADSAWPRRWRWVKLTGMEDRKPAAVVGRPTARGRWRARIVINPTVALLDEPFPRSTRIARVDAANCGDPAQARP